jgi:hypothetical protein
VQAKEGFLHDVLGGGPVTEDDHGEPDQTEGVPPVEGGQLIGRPGIRGLARAGGQTRRVDAVHT